MTHLLTSLLFVALQANLIIIKACFGLSLVQASAMKRLVIYYQLLFPFNLLSILIILILGIVDSKLPTVSVFAKKPHVKQSDKVPTNASAAPTVQAADSSDPQEFLKGVIFYLRDERIVGIVLWNIFNQINTARAIIKEDKTFEDINDIAKRFDIQA